jgi:hypothetical protein
MPLKKSGWENSSKSRIFDSTDKIMPGWRGSPNFVLKGETTSPIGLMVYSFIKNIPLKI